MAASGTANENGGFLSSIGSTINNYVSAASRAVLGFPKRRRLNAKQDEILSEYDELAWDEIQAEKDDDIDYDQRKQEIRDEYFDLERQKVDTWDGRTPDERAEERIDALLADKPPDTRNTVKDQMIPRYLDEREEFGWTRPRIMRTLDDRPTSDDYEDMQHRAYMTDQDIRAELFESEIRQYADDLSDDERDELVEQVEERRQYQDEQADDADTRFQNPDIQRQRLEDEIDAIIDRYDDADTVRRWLIPVYANESAVFGDDRGTMVDRLVDDYNANYGDLDTLTDDRVRRTLFTRMATDYGPVSDNDADQLSVYADELRQIPDTDYPVDDAAAPDDVNGNGNGNGGNGNGGDAQTDGGKTASYTGTAAGTSTGPQPEQPYTDESSTVDDAYPTVENEFLSTAGHRYRKLQDDDGVRYERDGEPISPQAYAGASAHKLPGY